MSNSQVPTPGPWHRAGNRTIVAGESPICEVFSGAVGIAQADANEAAIAALPDLIAALQRLVDRDLAYLSDSVMHGCISRSDVLAARLALEKAGMPQR